MMNHDTNRTLSLRTLSVAALAGALLLGWLAVAAPSASAAQLATTDPAHDTAHRGLDIVAAAVDNSDYTLTTQVTFARHRSGTTIVGISARGRTLLRVVNIHRADGRGRTILLDEDGRTDCAGLTSSWRPRAATLTVGVPSTCLWQGNYGAVRTWVVTERIRSGADVDFLLQPAWVARG